MKVLIVDDNAGTRNMIKIILEKTGHEVVAEAADGESALKAFREKQPEVVLLDIIMPGKSGVEVLEDILNIDKAAKVIMVTAVEQDEINRQLLTMGAAAIIYKPFAYTDFGNAFKMLK